MGHIQKSQILQNTAQNASLTFSAPGAGKYNCVTDLEITGDTNSVITITSGSKSWTADLAGGTGFEKAWQEPWVGAENTSIVIAVSAGSYRINARGFVTP